MMRKKVQSEGRSTLYITDKKLWAWAKKHAASRGYASASEFIFNLIKSEKEKGFDETLLKAIENYYELNHYTIGVMADTCNLSRKEIIEWMLNKGFSIDAKNIENARKRIHDMLRAYRIPPREEVIYSKLINTDISGITLLAECFEDSEEFRHELAFYYNALLSHLGEDRELRMLLEKIIEEPPVPTSSKILKNLQLDTNKVELWGPMDWRPVLLYFSAIGLFYKEMGLLHQYLGGQKEYLQELLRAIHRFFYDLKVFWGNKVQTKIFQTFWRRTSYTNCYSDGILPPMLLVSEKSDNIPTNGRISDELVLIDHEKSYYPIKIDDFIKRYNLPIDIKFIVEKLPKKEQRIISVAKEVTFIWERWEDIYKNELVPDSLTYTSFTFTHKEVKVNGQR
jgi:hypothetical protein